MNTESPTDGARRIFLVEDDPDARALIKRWIETKSESESKSESKSERLVVVAFEDAEGCLGALRDGAPDAVLLDVDLPGMSGLAALQRIHALHPDLPVVMLTAHHDVKTIVEAMRAGAQDYLPKPLDRDKLQSTVRAAVARAHARGAATSEAREPRPASAARAGIIAGSAPMLALMRQLDRVAASDISVLVLGESGTGKELIARAVHAGSERAAGPFIAVNCASVPEALMESEFFGHERGSFTGAGEKRQGRFEQAHGGTLFLDEIGELGLPLQAKLLRVLQERCFHRVGGSTEVRSNFRLLTATHRDLAASVRAGGFREDLFFRVAVLELELPPLRARPGDIRRIAEAFAAEIGGARGLPIAPDALAVLEQHTWPGNVRELHNVIQRAAVVGDGAVILPQDLPARLKAGPPPPPPSASAPELGAAPPQGFREMKREALRGALERSRGNVTEAVRELGIGRTTAYRQMKEFSLR